MKHYYSIANFITGTVVNGYDYLFKEYATNQQLFGNLTSYSQGNSDEMTIGNLALGIKPVDFPYNWDVGTIQRIGGEFLYSIENLEHSNEWNGDAKSGVTIDTPAFKLVSDWSTATTITAGVLDTIDYYTNYNFLSWSSSIGLPNMIMKNIEWSYKSFEVNTVLMGLGAGAVGLGAIAVGAELGAAAGLGAVAGLTSIIIIIMVNINNSLEQVYENSAPIDNYVDNNITTEIESASTFMYGIAAFA